MAMHHLFAKTPRLLKVNEVSAKWWRIYFAFSFMLLILFADLVFLSEVVKRIESAVKGLFFPQTEFFIENDCTKVIFFADAGLRHSR